jgi:hypothetical protein
MNQVPVPRLVEIQKICDEIATCIDQCDEIKMHRYVKGRIARVKVLIRSEKINNKGQPPSERSDLKITEFEERIRTYEIDLHNRANNLVVPTQNSNRETLLAEYGFHPKVNSPQ